MPSTPTTPLRQAWLKWKSLRLPWRKRFLVGLDLQGNTFWEFRDTLSSHQNRMRRIVEYPRTTQYSEVKISPQWHQWLRHTRPDPPSIVEQSQDIIRQQNLKVLAARADARWAAKPGFLDAPGQAKRQPLPALQPQKDSGAYAQGSESEEKNSAISPVEGGLGDNVEGTSQTVEPAFRKGTHKGTMQVPDGIRHPFNRHPAQAESLRANEKEKEDPWQQPRGGPSEEWQPKTWDGGIATRRK